MHYFCPHHPILTERPSHTSLTIPRSPPHPCRSILTDDYLRAKGSDGSIFILGDASTIDQPKALDLADELFEKYDANGDGKLQVSELRTLLAEASKTFSHLEEHAKVMER
jgi:NADH:ubiquinone reductase (non-electrogenic)